MIYPDPKSKKWILQFFIIVILNNNLFSQNLPHKIYTINDGLAGMQCFNVFKDSRGFIWTITSNGLSRFDGENFTNYNTENGLENNLRFSNLIELSDGRICFLNGKYLHVFDNKTFYKYKLPEFYSFQHNLILYNYGENEVLLFLSKTKEAENKYDSYLFNFQKKIYKKVSFPLFSEKEIFIPAYYDKVEKVFLGFKYKNNLKTGFYKFKNGKYEFLLKSSIDGEYHLTFSNNGRLFVGIKDQNLNTYFYYYQKGSLRLWYKSDSKGEIIINEIDQDAIAEKDGSIFYIEKGSKKKELISDRIGIASNYVIDSLNQIIWIATEKGLVSFFNNGIKNISEKDAGYVWSVSEDKYQNIWMMSYGTESKIWNGKSFKPIIDHKHFFPFFSDDKILRTTKESDFFYFGAATDKLGNIWLPNGSALFKTNGRKIDKPLNLGSFYSLYDKDKNIIFSGGAYGVHILDAATSKVKLFLKGGKDLIDYPNYMYLYKDTKGRYWIGGWGGMNRFENYEDLLARKSKEYSKLKGNIPFRGFITMYEDPNKTLWVGTTNGLFYYDDSEDKFIQVLQERLKGYVMFIGNIAKDKLIIGIDAGLMILQIDIKSKGKVSVVKLYNNNNGYDGLEPGQNGLFTDSKERMWVTSGTVLSFLDPKKLNLNNEPLRPYFQKIDDKGIEFNSWKIISIKNNTFTLKIGSIGFNRPQKTLYSHKIDENKWSDWVASDQIFVKPLSNGSHKIQIRAKTEGIAEDRLIPVVLNVNVTAPFYQSPNFAKYLGFISAILFGWFLYSFFKSRYEKRKLLEKERTINYLQIQTLQAQLNPHFLFNALSSLQNLILKNETALANKSLTKLASLMRRYLESSVAANNPRVKKNEVSLKDKIELLKSYLELESIQHQDKFSYKIEYPSDLQLDSIKLPPLIIQPFVENAIKHGLIHNNQKGNLTIKFETIDETLVCTIDDDGIGRRASADLKKQSEHSYKSLGTRLVHERVKLLNETDYDIKIETIDKIKGTTVIIKIQQKYED